MVDVLLHLSSFDETINHVVLQNRNQRIEYHKTECCFKVLILIWVFMMTYLVVGICYLKTNYMCYTEYFRSCLWLYIYVV